MRVFEEVESAFKLFARVPLREGIAAQLLDDDQLVLFQLRDAPLIGRDDGCRRGFDDPVEELFDLLFGLAEIVPQGLGDLLGAAAALIPRFEEQLLEQAGGLCCRAQALQNFAELGFNHITLDGFAAGPAALGEAVIIGVLLPGLAC